MIVAVLAKRLPVGAIPEQNGITPVRNDMVNNRGRRQLAVFSAFCAERILFEELRPGRPPFAVITSFGSILTGIQLAMSFTVYAIREVRTAGMPAGALRFSGHEITSQYQQTTMIVDGITGVQVLHSPVKRHNEGNRAINFFGGFLLIQLQIAGGVCANVCVVHIPA